MPPMQSDFFTNRRKSHHSIIRLQVAKKSTSTTGHIRKAQQINQRVQDGIKEYFLCQQCEDDFSKFEQSFSTNIFHPFTSDINHSFEYDSNYLNFAVLCCWRVLAYATRDEEKPHFKGKHTELIRSTLDTWKEFLLGERNDVGGNEIHCLALPGVFDASFDSIPDRLNRYLLRVIEAEIFGDEDEAFVYVKLGPLAFFGIIEYPDLSHWVDTRVDLQGTFKCGSFKVAYQYGEFILNQAYNLDLMEKNMIDKQLKKIKNSYEKDLDRVAQSETFRAYRLDKNLKGTTSR